jgi:hypothetical protein
MIITFDNVIPTNLLDVRMKKQIFMEMSVGRVISWRCDKILPTTRGQAFNMSDIHMVSESSVIDFMPIPIMICKTMRFEHSEEHDTDNT